MRALLLSTALCIACANLACGGSDEPDVGPTDLGPQLDNGIHGPDEDSDEWTDELDNCSSVYNPEQRDRDRDGVGDLCDTCPATPNGATGVGQDGCDTMNESEPNDQPGAGELVSLVEMGKLREVRGILEEPTQEVQAYDRFSIMVPARTMLRVRVARGASTSLLEPMVIVSGGAFTAPRIADGLFVAEREIYVGEAGMYEVAVTDRLGVLNNTARGDTSFTYALSIEAVEARIESVSAPFENRSFDLSPLGTVKIFEAQLEASDFTRIATQTDVGLGISQSGLDSILIVETEDGATVVENDALAAGFLDARVILALAQAQTVRIVLDYSRALGGEPNHEIRLTVDQPPTDEELEPNDNLELATKLIFPGETSGRINLPLDQNVGPPDIDWYYFDGMAGQVVAFSGIIPGASNANPALGLGFPLGEELTADNFKFLYTNTDSSGNSPRIEVILHEDRRYYLLVADEANFGMPPFAGGPLFDYGIFAEVVGLQPDPVIITSTQTFSGEISSGGRLKRHLVTTAEPTILSLRTEAVGVPELVPHIRVYGPSVRGIIGDGVQEAFAFLPAADTYVISVHNEDNGLGAAGMTYDILAHFKAVSGATAETEPNDLSGSETDIGEAPAVGIGEQVIVDDIDRYAVTLTQGVPVNISLSIGQDGRNIDLFNDAGMLLMGGPIIQGFDPPATGIYHLEITSTLPSRYTVIVSEVQP